ncbi:MAG: RNA degradosome polyphosphate kinase [Paraprevotella sp.]|nr:RNA degradosome polyphosphate kinase [Paraprevotella sp.]
MKAKSTMLGAVPMIPRDLRWMYFNNRILQAAQNPSVPLLERLGFMGIYSNNLDEFFRVRMATLTRIAESNIKQMKDQIEEARATIKEIYKLNNSYNREFEYVVQQLFKELADEKLYVIDEKHLNEQQEIFIKNYFRNSLAGFTNPLWLSQADKLANENDDTIYLAVKLTRWHDDAKKPKKNYAQIRVPVDKFGRFVVLPAEDDMRYIMYLDDVVRYCLPIIFASVDYDHFEAYSFKFTKDAEMELENESDIGTVQNVQRAVKSRKNGDPIRVIFDTAMPKDLFRTIMQNFSLDKFDTTLSGGRYQNHKDLMSFPSCGRSDLKYPQWKPLYFPTFTGVQSMLDLIIEEDRFLHVPYHSFDHYIQLLCEAAISPRVKSIKTTLYRVAKDSKVVEALIAAAKNGKKVTVVIELLARFDESSNIKWSKRMKDSGINVIFGVEGLKVHSKLLWIEMVGGNHIACIGTGNFHEGNAQVYTDCLLMTASPDLVKDVANVFRFIEKPFLPAKFRELLVSPNTMKNQILAMIQTEIRNKRLDRDAYIKVKINHITDEEIVKKLYEASAEGVEVDLLVRGNCSLVTGIPGKSDHIHVHGIIDRYLEHSRILIFCNGGNERYFIGSADWMPRNLDNRIEVMAPVYNPRIQKELRRIVEWGLLDNQKGRVVDGTGKNLLYENPDSSEPFRSQERLYFHYAAQIEEMKQQ